MSKPAFKLNLRPHERRLVVIIGLVFFVVLNIWFVWPHFDDWQKIQNDTRAARASLAKFQAAIARTPQLEERLKKLEGEGSTVLPAEQALELMRKVHDQARQSGVNVINTDPRSSSSSKPNDFFEEQAVRVSINTGDKELVDFLVKLGGGNSMIRVRDLDLKPQLPAQTRLEGSMTLVGSYQKKPPARPGRGPAPPLAATGTRNP